MIIFIFYQEDRGVVYDYIHNVVYTSRQPLGMRVEYITLK